jgi:hypothetical protein
LAKRCHAHEHGKPTRIIFFFEGGGSITMPAIAFALLGFVAGLFVMTVISLYKYIIKVMSSG